MPNWCLNEVRVYCPDKETRDAFVKYCEGTRKEHMELPNQENINQAVHVTMEFNKILPRPEEEEENWYDWNITNWGTKWEPDIVHFDREDDTTVYWEMYTAWAPPGGIYNKMMEDWGDKDVWISWFYREDGMQFAGWLPD
jgi:hypothetical protein